MGIRPGRTAIVTGAGSGFGSAMARRLVDAEATVVGVDTSASSLERVAAELGEAFVPMQGDVRDPKCAPAAVAAASQDGGRLDTLIVSAGVIHIKPMVDVTEADWDLTLDVNLKGAFLAMQAAVPAIDAAGRQGRIVAISSDAGKRGFGGIAAYSASKFGLVGLVESLAVELAPSGATVNAVCPVGTPSTGMGRNVLDMKMRATGRTAAAITTAAATTNPLGRNATVEDVVAAIEFFLTDEAAFLTGNALDVDGGAHLGFLPGT